MAPSFSYATLAAVILKYIVLVGAQDQAFSVEPADSTATEGSSIMLYCSVTNKAGRITWVKDSTNPISVDSRIISTSDTRLSITGDRVGEFNLRIFNANITDAGDYTCQVSAAGSSSEIVSRTAVLTILNVQMFSKEPADTTGAAGSTVTLMCSVNNKEGFLSWRRDSLVISNETRVTNSNSRFSIVGDRMSGEYNLQIIAAQEQDEGMYNCFVTANGTSPFIESRAAFLNIISLGTQRLTIGPTDTIVTEGTTATLRCTVADKAGVVSWLQNSQAISYDMVVSLADERYTVVGNHTIGEFDLQINNVAMHMDQGTYHCIVNAEGNNDAISSRPANLITRPAVSPDVIYPECIMTPSGNLREGDKVILSCLSRGGEPQPELFWLKNSQDFDNSWMQHDTYTRNDVILVLTNDLIGTVFECHATHPAYVSTKSCILPHLTFELIATINVSLDFSILKVDEDASGTVICSATGDPVILGYAWYYNGVEISDSDGRFVIESVDNTQASLTIASASLSMDESVISCEARNRIDKVSVYTIVRIIEDNVYTILLAILGLVAIFVFVLINVPFVVYYFWRKKNEVNKVAPRDVESVLSVSKQVSNNYSKAHELNLIANANAKNNCKPLALLHTTETNGVPTTAVLQDNPGTTRRISAFEDLYPPERSSSSVLLNGKKATYDVSGSVVSSASFALPNNSIESRRASRISVKASTDEYPGENLRKPENHRKTRGREFSRKTLSDASLGLSYEGRSSSKKHRSKDEKKQKHKHKDGESKEHRKRKESREHKEHNEHKEHREHKAHKEQKEHMKSKDHKDKKQRHKDKH